MSSPQTFVTSADGPQRRVLAYFLVLGGVGLPLTFSAHLFGLLPQDGSFAIAIVVFGAFSAVGALSLFERVAVLHPGRRQLSETVRLLSFVVQRRHWAFDDLECVVERSGWDSDSDVHWRWIGLRTSSGSIVWLRCFHTRTLEPAKEVVAFRTELALLR
jgi:hypothetical protein